MKPTRINEILLSWLILGLAAFAAITSSSCKTLNHNSEALGNNWKFDFEPRERWTEFGKKRFKGVFWVDRNMPMRNIEFKFKHEIYANWKFKIISHTNDHYVIQSTEPYTDHFVFLAESDSDHIEGPSNIRLSPKFDYQRNEVWHVGGGKRQFKGTIWIDRELEKDIKIAFDYNYEIYDYWRFKILKHVGNHYVIQITDTGTDSLVFLASGWDDGWNGPYNVQFGINEPVSGPNPAGPPSPAATEPSPASEVPTPPVQVQTPDSGEVAPPRGVEVPPPEPAPEPRPESIAPEEPKPEPSSEDDPNYDQDFDNMEWPDASQEKPETKPEKPVSGSNTPATGDTKPAAVQQSNVDQAPWGTPVGYNGWLKVVGTEIRNQNGQAIQLKGISSHGLHWNGKFMNPTSIALLKNTWKVSLIRAAMYTDEGGYLANRSVKNKVHEIVKIAIDNGLYVIIDWHILKDRNPMWHVNEAKEFFDEMSRTYAKYPNVIYEICNEPNGWDVNWNGAIKPFAEQVIPVIRKNDPENIIVVGTPQWSADLDSPSRNPVQGGWAKNLMYAFHYYAGSHGDVSYKLSQALGRGLPIFVTEWGVSSADGRSGVFKRESDRFLSFLEQRKISWASWSLADDGNSSSLLRPGAEPNTFGNNSQLSEAGYYIKYWTSK